MKYLRLYENKDIIYYIKLDEEDGMTTSNNVELSKKLIDIFNKQKIDFKIYFVPPAIFFIFYEKPELPIIYDLKISTSRTENLRKDIEKYLVKNNDIELYYKADKYNL